MSRDLGSLPLNHVTTSGNMTSYRTFPALENTTEHQTINSLPTSSSPTGVQARRSSSVEGVSPSNDVTIDMDPFDRHFAQNQPPYVNGRVPHRRRCYSLMLAFRDFLRRDDILKCLLAFMYLFCVMLVLSHLLVVVHLRMPNNATWGPVKPLPDILLEWFPLQTWGLWLSEVFITTMSISIFVLAAFHERTFVFLRRMFCIMAAVFFLRSFCVLVTSLTPSVVQVPEDCGPLQINTTAQFIEKAFRIFAGMGMRLQGGQTCGDYVYSGHTCSLTIFNLFFVSYTPNQWYFMCLKVTTTCINVLGMVGILVSHEHYSVDVILGAAISYLVFTEYHYVTMYLHLTSTSLDNHDSGNHRYWRIKLTSPITYLMERGGEGRVQNRFRVPFYHWCKRSQWQALDEADPQ